MLSRALTVATVAALGVTTGCANARLRSQRQAVIPMEDPAGKSEREAKPVWFTPDGKSDGRPNRGPRWADGKDTPDGSGTKAAPVIAKARKYPNVESPLGTNLAPVGPQSRDWVFVDLFRMASPWQSKMDRPTPGAQAPEQDPQGWVQALVPGQSAVTRLPTFGGGKFVVLYKGRGVMKVQGATTIDARPGRITYQAGAHRTVSLVIENTNPSDHIREIHVVPSDFEATYEDQIFHPLFLQRLSRFSVLRFTGWARAEQAAAPTWDRRVTPAWYTQGGPRGVAYEYMVMLANELGTDIWLSVPHRANDKLVEELGAFLTDRLDPDLKVYLEYGTAFERDDSDPSRYARQQGQFMGLDANPKMARLKYQVRRSLNVFRVFATRFETERTFRVLAGTIEDEARTRLMLSHKNAAKQVDLLAVAPYVGVRVKDTTRAEALAGMTPADFMDALEFTSLPAVMSQVRAAQRVAAEFGVGLCAYSGGQELKVKADLPNAKKLNQLFDTASRDPRGAAVYSALLSGWAKSGGELFVHSPLISAYGPQSGRAGALEYQDQGADDAPRYGALMAFAENNQRWWGKRRAAPPAAPTLPAVTGPVDPTAGLVAESPPESRSTAIWAAGGAGLAAAAAGAVFTGLYLRSTAARDRFIADDPFPQDGARGRQLDNEAYNYSLALTTSFGLAAAGFGSAMVMDLMEEVGYDGVNPGMAISAGAGVVALITSATFFVSYLNVLNERDSRLETNPSPVDAVPFRNLDDEAFRFSLASGTALGVSAASFALALTYYLLDRRDPYLESYYGDEAPAASAADDVEVLFAPNGLVLKW